MSIRIDIDSRIRLPAAELRPEELDGLKGLFAHDNPQREAKRSMGIPGWQLEPKEIRTWTQAGDAITFPRGGLKRICEKLNHWGRAYDLDWEGVSDGDPIPTGWSISYQRRLWEHQEEIVQKIVSEKQGIVRSYTGSGKTEAVIAAIAKLKLRALVVLPNKGLLTQWDQRVQKMLGIEPNVVGIRRREKDSLVTLGVWKTVGNRVRLDSDWSWRDQFGALFLDEAQLAPANTFFECVDAFPARVRVGVTSDHRRKDRKEFLSLDLFGEPIIHVPYQRLVDAGHVVDVECRIVPTHFRAAWYGKPEGGARKPIHRRRKMTDEDPGLDIIRLHREMAADDEREAKVLSCVMMEMHRGLDTEGPILVMAHERDHCRQLASRLVFRGIPAGLLIGGDDFAQEFAQTLQQLADGRLKVAVGTFKAVGTGLDLPALAAVVAATPIAGNEQFFGQVRGRACRAAIGKRNARFYVLWDKSVFPAHARNVARWNKSTIVYDEDASSSSWMTLREWERRRRVVA